MIRKFARALSAYVASFFVTKVLEVKAAALDWQRPESDTWIDLPEDQLRYIYEKNECLFCRSGKGMYEGPRGGASINMFCGNPDCDSRFNVVDPNWGFVPMGQFTGRCPPDFIQQRRDELTAEAAKLLPVSSSMY
jgi:hypothetical protein